MIFSDSKLIAIFCDCDDFCKIFEPWQERKMVGGGEPERKPTRKPGLVLSEIMCILIVYHLSGMKRFEYYYHELVEREMMTYFPGLPCYERFVALMPRAAKRFISQKAFEYLYMRGLKLVTTIRKNMKNKLMPLAEKPGRMKRGIIESVNHILMTVCDIDHTRHRSPINAIANAYAGVAAYTYLGKLPSVIIG